MADTTVRAVAQPVALPRSWPSVFRRTPRSQGAFKQRARAAASRGSGKVLMVASGDLVPQGVCANPDPATKDFIMQQTMIRIKDPKKSLDFYTRILGMRLLCSLDFPEMKFSLYFVGYADPAQIPSDDADKVEWCFKQPGTVELTYNYGTDTDPEFAGYHNGNTDPRGFGHVGISVPDVYDACKRFEELGVEFVKRPDDGKMKGLAFIKDPDGYWIEVLAAKRMRGM